MSRLASASILLGFGVMCCGGAVNAGDEGGKSSVAPVGGEEQISPILVVPAVQSYFVTNAHGKVIRRLGTPTTNAAVTDVWSGLTAAAEPPGAHRVTTNANGELVHHFSMQPVVTNSAALTNLLSMAEQRQSALDAEMKGMPMKDAPLRRAMMENYNTLVNIATNYVPEGAEGKKLVERIAVVEKELKDLRGQLVKYLETDPAYVQAKAKLDANTVEFKAIQERKQKLREERTAVAAELMQLRSLEAKEAVKKVSEDKPRPGTP
jgi:hypothetical protein